MRTYVRGVAPRPAWGAAGILGLLLLAAAATTRAAAIRGPLTPAAVATQGSAHPAPRAANTTSLDVCSMKVAEDAPPRHADMDPLHKYLRTEGAATQRGAPRPAEPDSLTMYSLPEGCEDVSRLGHKMLRCSGASMTTLPDLSLERNVDSLVFMDTGIQVVSDVSRLPRSVQALTFARGPLVTFNGHKFYQVSGLETLSLEKNTLSTWSFVSAFYSSDSPRDASIRALYLPYNLITYPPQPAGNNETVLPLLETLVMSHNPMDNLPGSLFQPLRTSPLKFLFLRNCSLSQFYGSPLEPVSGVEVLDLSYNSALSNSELQELLAPLTNGSLKELYLANNNYVTVPTKALAAVSKGLQMLDLHGSAFQCLDNNSFPLLPQLKHLNLMYSRIAAIRPHTFEVFPVLEVLNLDGNYLMTVPTEVLLPTLKVLTMSDNPRSTGDEDNTFNFSMEYVDFEQMSQLSNVTFEGVPLDHVEVTFFNDLHGLLDLRLTSCKIRYIEPFSFVNLTLLRRLQLNNNELEVLLNDTFAGLVSLTHLDLSSNKLVFRTSVEPPIPPRSAAPPGLPLAVTTWLQGRRGERSVHTATDRSLSTTYLPLAGLAALEYLDLANNGIRILTANQWWDLRRLVQLSLRSNNVQEWYSPVFSNLSLLSVLDLSYNSLSTVTENMLQDFSLASLESVNLNHNPYQCGCSLQALAEGINTSVFVEFSTYRCSLEGADLTIDEYITNASCEPEPPKEDMEQPQSASNRLEIIVFSVSMLLSIVTTATLYRKRWYLRYLVYKVKMKADQYKEDTEHYLYDIFVCYSQADRQWVFEHLVARLEDGGRYRVCVHERDFTVGQEITENIITAVERSRKVVMVLSPAFVDSSWCMFELQLASHKILDERRDKLILVLLEALPTQRQPKKLRFLLRSRTYLAWNDDPDGQRLFWVRLQRAVTRPTASEAVDVSTHM